jgi:hypothetical protein
MTVIAATARAGQHLDGGIGQLDTALTGAPMTGASRAAIQRDLAWMEARGLMCGVTSQGRHRMWRATN